MFFILVRVNSCLFYYIMHNVLKLLHILVKRFFQSFPQSS